MRTCQTCGETIYKEPGEGHYSHGLGDCVSNLRARIEDLETTVAAQKTKIQRILRDSD